MVVLTRCVTARGVILPLLIQAFKEREPAAIYTRHLDKAAEHTGCWQEDRLPCARRKRGAGRVRHSRL